MVSLIRAFFKYKTSRMMLASLVGPFIAARPKRVIFVTRADVPIAGNLRAVIDAISRRGGYELAVFRDSAIRDDMRVALQQAGVRCFERFSWAALRYILSSGTVVLTHSARDAYLARRRRNQRVINVWHGVALKRIELLMRRGDRTVWNFIRRRQILRNARIYDAMIASSPVDRLVITAAFGVPFEKVHPIGLPRFDYLASSTPLPSDLRSSEQRLLDCLKGRRLVLYAPTFREKGPSALTSIDETALAAIRTFCIRHNTVFGIRSHPYEADQQARSALFDGVQIIDLGTSEYAEPNLLLRHCSAMVVDYSSIWVDFMLLRRPVIAFVPDLEIYSNSDRGFIYDQATIFPGPLLASWTSVAQHLYALAGNDYAIERPHAYEFASRLLLNNSICGSFSEGVVDVVLGGGH